MHVKFGNQNNCHTERILIRAQLNKSTLRISANLSCNHEVDFCCAFQTCRDLVKPSQPGACNQALRDYEDNESNKRIYKNFEELCVRVKSLKTLSTWKLEQLNDIILIKRLSLNRMDKRSLGLVASEE